MTEIEYEMIAEEEARKTLAIQEKVTHPRNIMRHSLCEKNAVRSPNYNSLDANLADALTISFLQTIGMKDKIKEIMNPTTKIGEVRLHALGHVLQAYLEYYRIEVLKEGKREADSRPD